MSIAPQQQSKTVSEVRNVAVSFAGKLDSGEALTGTPNISEVDAASPQDLTFANIAVSTGALTINGETVAAGEAITFKVSGGTANKLYKIQIDCGTDATPAQTLYGVVRLAVKADS